MFLFYSEFNFSDIYKVLESKDILKLEESGDNSFISVQYAVMLVFTLFLIIIAWFQLSSLNKTTHSD